MNAVSLTKPVCVYFTAFVSRFTAICFILA